MQKVKLKRRDHKLLLREARSKMTPLETKRHAPPFQSQAWEARKQAKANKVAKAIERAQLIKTKRPGKVKGGVDA